MFHELGYGQLRGVAVMGADAGIPGVWRLSFHLCWKSLPMNPKPLFVFPKWSNTATVGILLALLLTPLYVGVLLAYGANPTTLSVGYQPIQPVPYSHAVHVGKLGLDCRYCHNTVEKAGMAALPPTDTCMNCHSTIWWNNDPAKRNLNLRPVFESYETGNPIPWIKVHDLPDYVYFNHSAHVNVGVSCVECHGQVNRMEVVAQTQPLNMAWCLECHRDPAPRLRPRDQVTNLDWTPPGGQTQAQFSQQVGLKDKYHVNANTDCVTCHR